MLFLAILLLGAISYARLPIDLLPDISYPKLVVYTSYPDVAPGEIERLITEHVEANAAAVPGVERVTSVSREGVSLVTLRFAWGGDMDFAMLNVRERMDNLRGVLPESATRTRILRVDPDAEPIMVLSVAGETDLWETKELAETVFRRRLEQLDGVAQAAVTGGLDREIQVDVDSRLLDAYGLTPGDVAQALAHANVSAPGGTIRQGRYRYPLRTLGELRTVDEIGDGTAGDRRGRRERARRVLPAGLAARRGVGHGRLRRSRSPGPAGRPRGHRAAPLQGGGCQDGRGSRGRGGGPRAAPLGVPSRHGERGLQSGGLHLGGHRERGAVTSGGRTARLSGAVLLPARPALPGGDRGGHSNLAHGDVRAHAGDRRLAQHHEPGRAGLALGVGMLVDN